MTDDDRVKRYTGFAHTIYEIQRTAELLYAKYVSATASKRPTDQLPSIRPYQQLDLKIMATAKKSVQVVLKEMFPDKEFIVHYKPSYLKNTLQRQHKGSTVTNRQLSISFYCEEMKFGVCCTSVPMCTWYEVGDTEMQYYRDVDEFKVNECKKNGITVVLLPIVPENIEGLVMSAYKQHIAGQ